MTTSARSVKEDIIKAGLKPPKTLTLMITDACNMSCPHCLLDCKGAGGHFVLKDTVTSIIDDFKGLGGEMLHITGGEPLLHPDGKLSLTMPANLHAIRGWVLPDQWAILTSPNIKKDQILLIKCDTGSLDVQRQEQMIWSG
jgi:hypothetical protein